MTQTAPNTLPATRGGANLTTKSRDRIDTIRDLLQARVPAMSQVLPKHLTAERLMRLATFDIAKTPSLLECDPKSLVSCVLQAAQLGLEPGIIGHAYLVPFKGQATLIIGYKGLIDLVRRSGQLSTIQAQVVYRGDAFDYDLGLDPKLTHKRAESYDGRPEVTHAYAVARLKDGSVQFEVMTRSDIEAIRSRARSGSSGPWTTDYAEMAKKTVLRRLCKMLPVSVEVARAVEAESAQEAGVAVSFDGLADESIPSGEGTVIDQEPTPIESAGSKSAKAAAAKAAAKPTGNGTEAALRTRFAKACQAAGYKPEETAALVNAKHPGMTLDQLAADDLQALAAQAEEPALAAANLDAIRNGAAG